LANCCFEKVFKNKSLDKYADFKKAKTFYKMIINFKKDYSYAYKNLELYIIIENHIGKPLIVASKPSSIIRKKPLKIPYLRFLENLLTI